MPVVGYLEGTDSMLLSRLAAEGVETLPIANAWDHHGKYVGDLDRGEVSVVVGHLHKVIPAAPVRTSSVQFTFNKMFSACKCGYIPVLIIVPAGLENKAKRIIGDTGTNIHLVSPEEVESHIRKCLMEEPLVTS